MGLLGNETADWLAEQTEAADDRTLTLTRGARQTSGVPCTLGLVAFRLDSEEGRRVQVGDRDFLVRVGEYTVGGVAVKPEPGDRYRVDGEATTWELMDPGGEPAWRYTDATRTCYRLHVKRVGQS